MAIDLSPFANSWPFLLKAVALTVFISAMSMLLGFVLGVVVGALRTYGGRFFDIVLGFYVDTMRSIPLLVILIWIYFAFPLVIGASVDVTSAAIVGLGLHLGAYMAETIRAGLTSVRRGQMAAALALGMSHTQAIRTIILPQALIRMLPSLGSLFVFAIKDSAIASVIAVPELLRQTQVVAGNTYRPFELYTAAMIVYFLLCFPVARGVDWIYRRVAHLGSS
ncbi:MAG: amino acid ABC transporter permease [Rhizobiales bacterium]|nr:amino acid ABC transporter permease [Hyphomicrobiales bacterium]